MTGSLHEAIVNRGENNFGFLRLLFSLLVILAHSPELVDGDDSRELWHRSFGSFSFGRVAVDGFFLISGYLITKSFQTSKNVGAYLVKRVARIYPGFLVSFAISLIVVGWLAGGNFSGMSWLDWLKQAAHMLLLNVPYLNGAFSHLHYSALNGSMWTIAYEFRCYLLVIALGFFGLLKKRWHYLIMTLALVPVGLSHSFDFHLPYDDTVPYYAVIGELNDSLALAIIFLCGGAFYLFRDRIVYTTLGALAAAALLFPMLFINRLVEPGLAVFGGYLLFWFCFCAAKSLNVVGSKVDLSYGIYLYAWPVQSLLIMYVPNMSPWVLFSLASTISACFAYVSWTFVEHPFLRFKDRLRSGAPNIAALA